MADPAVTRSIGQAEPSDGLPTPQRYWAILSIALGLTLAVLDGAIANVALPTIAKDVNASPADSIWVVNAYQLTVTISLLPFASAGEIFGYRRVYRWGLAVFTLASLGCALSDSLVTLTMARIVQGFGAAGVMSVNGALVRFIYPRRFVGRGIGLNATVGSISSAVGPTVAAAILSVANWPWLFAVNLPIGAAALFVAMRALPATPRSRSPFDLPSALLSALSIGLLITAIDGFGHGERIEAVITQFLVAVVLGLFLVGRQMTRNSPPLPVDLLRIPLFAMSVATSICGFMAQGMALVSLPFLLENTLGRNEVQTGLLMTPWPLTVAFIAPVAGRLADRYKVGVLSGCGLAVLCGGLALLSALRRNRRG
ncbi:MAG TPA: MFS transporter [Acetobacteraceae bacterium]|nr:MFS transporter [Acetobacteraceae bacterium]